MKTIQKHYNLPQLRSLIIDAPSEVCIFGRGTGKTVGPLAKKTSTNYAGSMPRGRHAIIGASFTGVFTKTLPELMKGWNELGYKFDQHYIVGSKPTEKWKKKWRWPGPYAPITEFKYFISWWNGAVFQLLSQERAGSANGISLDSISGDEAKLLNEEKFNTELLPANRGIIPAFANNPNHHGITLVSDMPVGTGGRWLLNKVNAMDKQKINDIWKLQTARFDLNNLMNGSSSAKLKKEIEKQISIIDIELNSLRRNLLYYHEASTLDNIHALGLDYIKQQFRDSSTFQFNTQILNIRPLRMEDGFYPDLDENKHGYFKEDPHYFDNVSIDPFNPELDSRKDADCNPNEPLHISADYNRRIHPIVVGQDTGKELRALKNIYSLYPGKLKEALNLFIKYYKHHNKKVVYYWYDHTAVGGENEEEKYQVVINTLRKAGWVVVPMYIGKQPSHEARYTMWGHLLQEDSKYDRVFRVNRENCDKLLLSMGMAEAEQRKDGFGKNKKTEHDPKFPAEESTHFSDAIDTWVYGALETKLRYKIGDKGYNMIMTG